MKCMFFSALVVAASAVSLNVPTQVNTTDPATWKDCGGPSFHSKVTSVKFTPDPPVKGSTNIIVGSGSIDEVLAAGSLFNFVLNLDGVPLLTKKNQDICKDNSFNLPLGAGTVTVHALACPLPVGIVTLQIDAKISSIAPSGKVDVKVNAIDPTGADVLCVDVNFAI